MTRCFACILALLASAQTRPNVDAAFERLFSDDGVPAGWVVTDWANVADRAEDAPWNVAHGVLRSAERRGTWLLSERE